MDQPARGFLQRGLAELPEDALLHILYHLPADDRARVACISRRFAALVCLPELGVRLSFRCSTVHHVPSAVSSRLIAQATALSELDISQQHWSAGDAFSPLIMLSAAQRQQLTVLRCEPATALDATYVVATLENLPNLRCLYTDVSFSFLEAEPDDLMPFLAALPRLRIRRLKVQVHGLDLGVDDAAVPRLSARFVELFQASHEVTFGLSDDGANADPGVWQAFEQALAVLDARGCATTFLANAFQLPSHDHAALLRLVARPRVHGLVADCYDRDTLVHLLEALASPGCGVRFLTLCRADFLNDEISCRKLQDLLRSSAFPLETLVLNDCTFGYDRTEPFEPHPAFTQICCALADARALTELQVIGCALSQGDDAALALLIRANRNLRSLEVRDVLLEDKGVALLGAALCKPRTMLERLLLCDVFSRGDPPGDPTRTGMRAAAALAAALRENPRLRELHIGFDEPMDFQPYPWTQRETNIIWEAIAESRTLRYATLPYPVYVVDDEGARDPQGIAMNELELKAMYAENPRAADLLFNIGPLQLRNAL